MRQIACRSASEVLCGWRTKENHVARDHARVIVQHGRQPRPHLATACVEDQDIELGMIGLPDRIGALGAVSIHQLELVAEGGSTFMCQGQHRRINPAHDISHASVGRHSPFPFADDAGETAMDGHDRWRRFDQRHALDQFHQFFREGALAGFRSGRTCQPCRTIGTVAGEPAAGGTDRYAGIDRGLTQRHRVMEVPAKHGHPFCNFATSRFWLSIIGHGDMPCPKGDRSTDTHSATSRRTGKADFVGDPSVSFRWYYISCNEGAPYVTYFA